MESLKIRKVQATTSIFNENKGVQVEGFDDIKVYLDPLPSLWRFKSHMAKREVDESDRTIFREDERGALPMENADVRAKLMRRKVLMI